MIKMTQEQKIFQYLKEDLERNIRKYQEIIAFANENNLNDKYYLGARNATMSVLKLIKIYKCIED